MKKGISISTNTLIYFMIAIIVFLVLVAFIFNIVPGGSSTLKCQADLRSGCNKFITAGGCNEGSGLSIVTDDYVDAETARCALGSDDENVVKEACCGKTTTTTI